jgi:hypothetical protein
MIPLQKTEGTCGAMRDVVTGFYAGVLEKLMADNTISRTVSSWSVLVR